MLIEPLGISGVLLISSTIHRDARGSFAELWNARQFADAGLDHAWVQDNVAVSHQGVLRGLHCQVQQVQGKLIRCLRGSVFDVAVDLRTDSPTFGAWTGTVLTAEEPHMLWIPPGFAHGYYTLSDVASLYYKVTDFYAAEHERCIRWNDPSVGIAWPLLDDDEPDLSPKDALGVSLADARGWF